MIPFLTYLFESGMCLTLLFGVYFLFFRKETYFVFNRFYLLGILILSLLFPMIHLEFQLSKSAGLANRAEEIELVRNYYERLIAQTDPDYGEAFAAPPNTYQPTDAEDELAQLMRPLSNTESTLQEDNIQNIKTGFWAGFSLARLLLTLYLVGILFFVGRLLILIRWIRRTVRKYGYTIENGFKLVRMDEEVPPFSFFRFVFLHRETVSNSGFNQIIAHEKVHIYQRHSIDLLLAHFISVFQWFNPFVWLVNKAMKTNHEYIADRNVVEQGYELFDYQSLLLKQMISIRSVELVNNFNLINIKKRIAMMTKIKSGVLAQLKALMVIPSALFLFFFFAEINLIASTDKTETATFSQKLDLGSLQGFWENESADTYGRLLNFTPGSMQILERKDAYREYSVYIPTSISGGFDDEYFKTSKISKYVRSIDELTTMIVTLDGRRLNRDEKPIQFTIKNDRLIVEWTKDQVSVYKRIKVKSSLEYFSDIDMKDYQSVSCKYYLMSENPENTYHIYLDKNGTMFLNNERFALKDLQRKLWDLKAKGNPFDSWNKLPILIVDARCKMQYVYALYTEMRNLDELRHIISVSPADKQVPEIAYHSVGIPRVLPPKDAKMMDLKDIHPKVRMYKFDLESGERYEKQKLEKAIGSGRHGDSKFFMQLRYGNNTAFGDYLTMLDNIISTMHEKRNALAKEKFQLNYNDLAPAQQKQIRKVFPLILAEENNDKTIASVRSKDTYRREFN